MKQNVKKGTVPNFTFSLADAEVLEDIAQDVIGGDIAGDGGEVMDTLANVLAKKIA